MLEQGGGSPVQLDLSHTVLAREDSGSVAHPHRPADGPKRPTKEAVMPGGLASWDPFPGARRAAHSAWSHVRSVAPARWARVRVDACDRRGAGGRRPDLCGPTSPGVKPEDVKIEVENDILTISGSHEEQHERHVRHCGLFSLSMTLPAGVDAEHIKATPQDGVVEVTIQLPQEAVKETITMTPAAG